MTYPCFCQFPYHDVKMSVSELVFYQCWRSLTMLTWRQYISIAGRFMSNGLAIDEDSVATEDHKVNGTDMADDEVNEGDRSTCLSEA